MESDLYSRQMKWRENAKKKSQENKATNEEDPECTFEPKKFTKGYKKQPTGGSVLQKDISSHVVRQNKARQGKQGSPVSKSYGSKNSSLLPVEAMKESDNNYIDIDQRRLATPPSSPVQNSSAGLNGSHGPATLDNVDYSDETIADMLERERREWQSDRVKLIHCIHLQQLELTQRAVASHEKATEIAKEFARAIEGFEERLVSVENNVHKEISAIKSIAETLLLSSDIKSRNKGEADLNPMESRITHLENGVDSILSRLDNIATSIASNK